VRGMPRYSPVCRGIVMSSNTRHAMSDRPNGGLHAVAGRDLVVVVVVP
jgi:hypothetical protein